MKQEDSTISVVMIAKDISYFCSAFMRACFAAEAAPAAGCHVSGIV
jgi:hypothetical protein